MNEKTVVVKDIVEEVQRGEVTIGELLTISAMYPSHHQGDVYLDAVRKALRILQQQRQNNANN